MTTELRARSIVTTALGGVLLVAGEAIPGVVFLAIGSLLAWADMAGGRS